MANKEVCEVNPECATRLASIETKLDSIAAELSTIKHALNGNGKPGLIVDVDRLKQDGERQRWFIRAIGAATIGLIITTLGKFIFGK